MDYYDPRRRALRAVRQLLYPRECPFCGRVLGDVRDCPDCAVQLETLRRKPGASSLGDHEKLGGGCTIALHEDER